MRGYVHGNRAAFTRLFERLAPSVHAFFIRSVRSRSAAEDLVQTTFLHIHRARHSWRPDLPLRPWVFTIAARVRQDALRRTRGLREAAGEEEIAAAEAAGADAIVVPDAEVALFRRSRADRVRDALDALPESQRTVIHLHRYEELSFAENRAGARHERGRGEAPGVPRLRAAPRRPRRSAEGGRLSCEELRRDAAGLATLPPGDPEREAAYAHARGCAGCAAALREGERLVALLEALPPEPAPSAAVLRRASAPVLEQSLDPAAGGAPPSRRRRGGSHRHRRRPHALRRAARLARRRRARARGRRARRLLDARRRRSRRSGRRLGALRGSRGTRRDRSRPARASRASARSSRPPPSRSSRPSRSRAAAGSPVPASSPPWPLRARSRARPRSNHLPRRARVGARPRLPRGRGPRGCPARRARRTPRRPACVSGVASPSRSPRVPRTTASIAHAALARWLEEEMRPAPRSIAATSDRSAEEASGAGPQAKALERLRPRRKRSLAGRFARPGATRSRGVSRPRGSLDVRRQPCRSIASR